MNPPSDREVTKGTRELLVLVNGLAFGVSVGNLFLASWLFGSLAEAMNALGPGFWKNALDVVLASSVLLLISLSGYSPRLSRRVLAGVLPMAAISQAVNLASFVLRLVEGNTIAVPAAAGSAFAGVYVIVAAFAFKDAWSATSGVKR
jgi:hypothetical protein